jgi:hypothetical protein
MQCFEKQKSPLSKETYINQYLSATSAPLREIMEDLATTGYNWKSATDESLDKLGTSH